MTTNELAKLMGQKETDVVAFVECLKVWIAKGYTVEQSISKHMDQMTRLVNNSVNLPKELAISAFFPEVAK
jgi:hypothetical protein